MQKPWQLQVFSVSIRKKEKWAWARTHLQQYLGKNPQSRCLDVGAGVGTLGVLQEGLGGHWEFTETDAMAAGETRKIVRGPVRVIDVFSPTLRPNNYDLITVFDVIEHVPDPQKFMNRLHELLKPNGYIILTTPADDKRYYVWRRLAESVFGITKEAHGHVVEGFSREELANLTSRAGLQLLEATQFSFFFTEMVELAYNGAYILKNRGRQKTGGYNLALSPASGGDVTRHKFLFALLKITYPLLRGISLLDRLGIFRRGYEWGIVAQR